MNTHNTHETIKLWHVCLASVLVLCAVIGSAGDQGTPVPANRVARQEVHESGSTPRESTGSTRYAYLFSCSGNYVKLDAGTLKRVGYGTMWDSPSMAGIKPKANGQATDGCLLSSVQQIGTSSAIVAVTAKQRRNDDNGRQSYWISTIELGGLGALSVVGPLGPYDSAPRELVNSDGDQLLVIGKKASRYSLPELVKVKGDDSFDPTNISSAARWVGKDRIVDVGSILDGTGKVVHEVEGGNLLSDAIANRWRLAGRQKSPAARITAYADSAQGEMLYVGGFDVDAASTATSSTLVLLDALQNAVISAMDIPIRVSTWNPTRNDVPTARLVPGSRSVVVDRYEWRPTPGEGRLERFKTGEIVVYDLTRRELSRTAQLDPAPGFQARIIGFSLDGRIMYYGSRTRLYAVTLDTGEFSTTTDLAGIAPSARDASLVFTNE